MCKMLFLFIRSILFFPHKQQPQYTITMKTNKGTGCSSFVIVCASSDNSYLLHQRCLHIRIETGVLYFLLVVSKNQIKAESAQE